MFSSKAIRLAVFVFNFTIFSQIFLHEVCGDKPPLLTHCFVQTIHDKLIPHGDLALPVLFDSTTTLSYSIHEFNFFSLLPGANNTNYFDDDFDIDDVNVDIFTGYFRFYFRLSDSCMLFLIKILTFNETLTAIQRSGHGTSDHVLFLIETFPLTEENEVIRGFVNDLFNSEGTPFHAPIAFFNKETNEIATFCYFCPSSKIELFNYSNKNIWNDLQNQHFRINLNGYGNLVFIPGSTVHNAALDEPCFKNYNSERRRTNLFGEHVNCSKEGTWFIASIQPMLNISLTLDTSSIIEGNSYQKWMLQCRFFEDNSQFIPNIYAYTRDSLIAARDVKFNTMACLTVQEVQTFGLNFLTVLDFTSWCILVGLLLLYGFIYKDLWKSLDLFWALLGKEVLQKHDRKSLFIFLTAFSLLAYTYGSIYSADSMQLTDIPPFKTLIKQGYRFWLEDIKPFVAISRSVSNWTKTTMRRYIGGDPTNARYYFAGEGEQDYAFHRNDTFSLLKAAAKFKLFITSFSSTPITQAVGKHMVSINKNLICKVESESTDVEFKIDYNFRVWGYMSSRSSKLLTIINGYYERVLRLQQFKAESNMRNLEITKTGQLFEPKPIDLTSAVGLCCAICLAVYFCMLIWWGILMFKRWRRMVYNKIVHLKQRCFPKS
ncbi:unnamed protein product [Orchesella dallaii]|uniref:Uncharacterized protein n=1 Tax=Orchesella dallaii TaxID=48710 RepID=A0ABP1RVQ4_9HEXA